MPQQPVEIGSDNGSQPQQPVQIGCDIGSTTVKLVVMEADGTTLYKKYAKHNSDIKTAAHDMFQESLPTFVGREAYITLTGSAGINVATALDVQYIQEVLACTKAIEEFAPQTDVSIELGGEDAKISYFQGTVDQRMNSICAGGTGAFIEQMATLLRTDAAGLAKLAESHKMIYPIASRCFAAGTQVLKADGTAVSVEDVQVGDQLLGPDGLPRNVTNLVRGIEPLYAMTFCKTHQNLSKETSPTNKSTVYVTGGHQFPILLRRLRGKHGDSYLEGTFDEAACTVTTTQVDTRPVYATIEDNYITGFVSTEDYLQRLPASYQKESYVPFMRTAQRGPDTVQLVLPEVVFVNHHSQEVHAEETITLTPALAYYIGLWLGDGFTSGTNQLSVGTTLDTTHADLLTKFWDSTPELAAFGKLTRHRQNSLNSLSLSFPVSKQMTRILHAIGARVSSLPNGQLTHSPSIEVVSKTIPADLAVRLGNEENRLSFLAGLLDSDGHVRAATTMGEMHSDSFNQFVIFVTQTSDRDWNAGLDRLATLLGLRLDVLAEKAYTSKDGINHQAVSRFAFRNNRAQLTAVLRRSVFRKGLDFLPNAIQEDDMTFINTHMKASRTITLLGAPFSVDATPTAPQPFFGFELDGDHLHVLANGTVSHNCGVFAKTDVQPLLNEGAAREDVAASILQAVVNQTIAGLGQGRPIQGYVAFLGGPLFFMPILRKLFMQTLKLDAEHAIIPDDAHFFVAMGSALSVDGPNRTTIAYYDLVGRLSSILNMNVTENTRLPPLFKDEAEYEEFKAYHAQHAVGRADLASYSGDIFLGIDAGSTTTKLVLVGTEGELLHSYYSSNHGNPLRTAVDALKEALALMPDTATIVRSCVTGYGEALLQTGLRIDHGEIETVAHQRAADFFQPGCDLVLDIGGQDMKVMKVRHSVKPDGTTTGVIDNVLLNEACSSGCGSFIESFAKSMGLPVAEFAARALKSAGPVDLGSRCTVFMNSRVKQAQKEGATVEDISAGIALSVVKNALYKVIRLRDIKDLGDKIVVQGGTFLNDAVLRALETILRHRVVRPDISGLMGAFGAAIVAREQYQIAQSESRTVSKADLEDFTWDTSSGRCEKCQNKCQLTFNKFTDGSVHVSGNRCEKGAITDGRRPLTDNIPDMYRWKYRRLFRYPSLKKEEAPRGTIGIPRVLNQYEDYPFWHTFFSNLGFRVQISARSTKKLFESGMATIPSDSICYPAKLVHGHILDLVNKGVDTIFYPCVPFTAVQEPNAIDTFACPIVGTYPESIAASMTVLSLEDGPPQPGKPRFLHPFLPLDDKEKFVKRVFDELASTYPDLKKKEVKRAALAAFIEMDSYRAELRQAGEDVLAWVDEDPSRHAILLVGRPYHIDPEINHGINDLIRGFGYAVLSEDSVRHLGKQDSLRVLNQWTYHARIYAAATAVRSRSNVDTVQLVSFSCGLDAITTDQTAELLRRFGRIYTSIKIDEISNLGAARIRLRSLFAAIKERRALGIVPKAIVPPFQRKVFTRANKRRHTILIPNMTPHHQQFMLAAFKSSQNWNAVLLPFGENDIDEGLISVHNDVCYPSVLVVGQIMAALRSGKYDLNNTTVIMTQTGGPCRASNYVAFIRKALAEAGMAQVPVLSLSVQFLERNPGFLPNPNIGLKMLLAVVYGDVLMALLYRTRPYEATPGAAQALYDKWSVIMQRDVSQFFNWYRFKKNMKQCIAEFDEMPLNDEERRPRVGIVGEILVKYSPQANNNIFGFLEAEGAEVVVPPLFDFVLYCLLDPMTAHDKLSGSAFGKLFGSVGISLLEILRKKMKKYMRRSDRFQHLAPKSIHKQAKSVDGIVDLGNQAGEGWFLTAEMVELLETGTNNILVLSPFACLPNHINGKATMLTLKRRFPLANISAIDYDPGASEVNQISRIKLMMGTAFKRHKMGEEDLAKHVAVRDRHIVVGAEADVKQEEDLVVEQ
ncbi:2-hydroxyglutaryl-CoA dehydratase D-component [Carpediemonas membranifera]|uniref:N-acetyl-D-glucosamine kinase n=1 Tax=Carpediemonas membranifera TaxID=201153 RepID=A0A8J6E3W2_9EUKA|nr:2-hydroxyglutaryl-CoA dehydratase D-component [Carpediemonas membranifera]|eukprot:KAG9396086.1 2-hydroxyglutaryl-CoA dehydratase D-component [Carpediemonas membranifera]